jgi:hypothetical protein
VPDEPLPLDEGVEGAAGAVVVVVEVPPEAAGVEVPLDESFFALA